MRLVSRLLASAGAIALAAHPAFAGPPAPSPPPPAPVIGTMAGTAAAGNDPRITGAVQAGGPADTVTSGTDNGAAIRALSKMLSDAYYLRQQDALACTGSSHDDGPAIRAVLATMKSVASTGGTLRLPHANCYINSTDSNTTYGTVGVVVPQGVYIDGEGYQGTSVTPGVAMADVFVLSAALAGVRDLSIGNPGGNAYAQSAIQFNKPSNAQPAYAQRLSLTGFPTSAIHIENGDNEQIEKNFILNSGLAIASNNGGVNLVLRDNYAAGGGGVLLTRKDATSGQQGVEGGVIENNTVFALGCQPSLLVYQSLNLRVKTNTLENNYTQTAAASSACPSVVYDALSAGATYPFGSSAGGTRTNGTSVNNTISIGNEYGTQGSGGLNSALYIRGVGQFGSTGDNFYGRGNISVNGAGTSSIIAGTGLSFVTPTFYSGGQPAVTDMSLAYAYNVGIFGPQFSGSTNDILEGSTVNGYVAGGTFNITPTRGGGLVYGPQAYMPNAPTFGVDIIQTPGQANLRVTQNTSQVILTVNGYLAITTNGGALQLPGGAYFNTSQFLSAKLATFQAAEDHAVSTVTASFTFDATMQAVLAGTRSTALTAAVTGTLPTCTAATKGRSYVLKKRDSSSNNVTLAAAGSDTIDGAATVVLTAQNAAVSARCDGAGSWERGLTP